MFTSDNTAENFAAWATAMSSEEGIAYMENRVTNGINEGASLYDSYRGHDAVVDSKLVELRDMSAACEKMLLELGNYLKEKK